MDLTLCVGLNILLECFLKQPDCFYWQVMDSFQTSLVVASDFSEMYLLVLENADIPKKTKVWLFYQCVIKRPRQNDRITSEFKNRNQNAEKQ